MSEKRIQRIEVFMMIFIAITLLFVSYKIGEMNGRVQGIDRAIDMMESVESE